VGCKYCTERGARLDVQLPEDVREMPFDRSCGDEQGLRDLAVRQSLACQVRNAPLAGCERGCPAQRSPARLGAARPQLRLGRVAHARRTQTLGKVERLPEIGPRLDTPVTAAQHRAELREY